MSGTVAVRGETAGGRGGSGCLSRLDSDRCGHFRKAISGLPCACVRQHQRREKRCVSGHQLMLCILTVHLNLSLFILQQTAMARKANKHITWLGFTANVLSLGAYFWIYEFSSCCGEAWRSQSEGLGDRLVGGCQWSSWNLMRIWGLCKYRSTEVVANAADWFNVK